MTNISIIIPHKNSIDLLGRLLNSIPQCLDIQVVVVDNSDVRIPPDCFANMIYVEILYSDPLLGAGHARNVGLNSANGKWVVFADADDFFLPNAFETMRRYSESKADIIYFRCKSTNSDNGIPATRADHYNQLVDEYRETGSDHFEKKLRLMHFVPWGKMISKDLIRRHALQFDEVPASNDMMFSGIAGYSARVIEASSEYIYNVTITEGSLTSGYDQNRNRSRFLVAVRYNAFLKQRNLSTYQISLFIYLKRAANYGLSELMEFRRLYRKHDNGGLWEIVCVYLRNKFTS